ncbi:hypothetical protein M514_21441 [Trichuris suis]|uniref:DDE-1 domain-containing protein n=1 Tax=Trichuris suis TaxID=68888 RepID=A0A085NAB5_9BILA|nr:hypothetical protein M514_21441 [Trichuris suis]
MREEWSNWMVNGEKYYTAGGAMRAPSLELLCKFVINAWNKVKAETVARSFMKCCIANPLDGTGDDLLWEIDEDDGQNYESSSDTYDERVNEDGAPSEDQKLRRGGCFTFPFAASAIS